MKSGRLPPSYDAINGTELNEAWGALFQDLASLAED